MSKAAKKKEKQEWASEKPELDNARNLRGIYFIDPEEGEYKDVIENARKGLGVLVQVTMPCKLGAKKRMNLRETASESDESNNIQKTKHACIVEAHESTRKRLEPTQP